MQLKLSVLASESQELFELFAVAAFRVVTNAPAEAHVDV